VKKQELEKVEKCREAVDRKMQNLQTFLEIADQPSTTQFVDMPDPDEVVRKRSRKEPDVAAPAAAVQQSETPLGRLQSKLELFRPLPKRTIHDDLYGTEVHACCHKRWRFEKIRASADLTVAPVRARFNITLQANHSARRFHKFCGTGSPDMRFEVLSEGKKFRIGNTTFTCGENVCVASPDLVRT